MLCRTFKILSLYNQKIWRARIHFVPSRSFFAAACRTEPPQSHSKTDNLHSTPFNRFTVPKIMMGIDITLIQQCCGFEKKKFFEIRFSKVKYGSESNCNQIYLFFLIHDFEILRVKIAKKFLSINVENNLKKKHRATPPQNQEFQE